jgi:hypothetical protein
MKYDAEISIRMWNFSIYVVHCSSNERDTLAAFIIAGNIAIIYKKRESKNLLEDEPEIVNVGYIFH